MVVGKVCAPGDSERHVGVFEEVELPVMGSAAEKGEMTVGRVLDDTLRAKFQSWYPGLFNVQNADHTEHDLAA